MLGGQELTRLIVDRPQFDLAETAPPWFECGIEAPLR